VTAAADALYVEHLTEQATDGHRQTRGRG
jgi:hypothetical protein